MAANTAPIFSRAPDFQGVVEMTAANTGADLTSGTSYLAFTADATNGGRLSMLRIKAAPGANTAASVARVWVNNGSTLATASNSWLFGELALPATTATSTGSLPDFTFAFPEGFALPAGYRVYVTLGTAPGGSGAFTASCVGGKY